MQLIITPSGVVRCLYGEAIELHQLGQLNVSRGSHVEPTADGCWTADMAPLAGPMLGPFPRRSEALAAERDWIVQHWLTDSNVDANCL